jgi:Holliday junction resolvasome RuvABC endonuclease subunit
MIILGVDPGYRNLGLSIVDISEHGTHLEILFSKNMSVGKATAPLMFTKFLWPELIHLHAKYKFEAIASETPPFIMGQIKTTAFLWAVSSIIVSWAYAHKIPFKHASPISLKRGVSRILQIPWSRKYIPKKSDVKAAVKRLTKGGESCSTSHENDATLAAALMFSELTYPEKLNEST